GQEIPAVSHLREISALPEGGASAAWRGDSFFSDRKRQKLHLTFEKAGIEISTTTSNYFDDLKGVILI
ncbi:hypothetical protein OAF89_01870, partial [bacterium]|nr:hypothetical protein [bacterium]